ncbi:hypothetical protein N7517_006987 [Penicillium concentricum]|uniref:Glycosyl transferase CAP10 domain-containing protein n=1 Tax=Penicillium concentricum TaxID=293559 RepID=A0A9W9VD29_9EURO|nr:uncharacterized protein N7517_006987 [Penicillium concentricum]KAJ5374981.1 hypothetical protein N7517_006987 [Penicillium concentricum]
MKFLTRNTTPSPFYTTPSFSLWDRRWICLRWLGYLTFLITAIQTSSFLFGYPETNPVQAVYASFHRPGILRPGQYRGNVGVGDKISDEDSFEPDVLGMTHDRRDKRFYLGGTLTLTSIESANASHPVPLIYDPYPAYNSREWKKQFHGKFRPCLGPRGRYLDRRSAEDMIQVYKGQQAEFPAPRFGSYEALDLDGNVCTDRYSRFGAYGYDDDGEDEVPGFTRPPQCRDRYESTETANSSTQSPLAFDLPQAPTKPWGSPVSASGVKQFQPRSALLIRAWYGLNWKPHHREYIRALIMELSLHSGGEYQIYILCHVKENEMPIFSDINTINRLRNSIPKEFRNMALFFNNKLLEAWYPKIEEHSPLLQHHQPLQIFSQLYPHFDYYWQLEMDGRHTGHIYHFLDRAISFARQQPRKYLWERNAYFYTPGAHGNWSQFTQMVDESLADKSNRTIWGPVSRTGIRPLGPELPVPYPDQDNYTWGVGEEADFITFLPIFNPQDTQWTFPDKVWNFRYGEGTPRRAAVITMGRYSKRLLDLIHHAQATKGLGLASEMTGASWALFHGLKAVHVPHPIYADGQWTPKELARIYNPGPPENVNGGPDSIWNFDHIFDHIMYRLSYMFTTHSAEDLYRRWLGFRTAENEGGKTISEDRYGRHCFPSMFLHTIKNTAEGMGPDRAVP